MKLTTVEAAIAYAKTVQYSTDVMVDSKGEYHVVDHSALPHYKKHFTHVAEVKQTPVVTLMPMENITIEIDGDKWLIVEASDIGTAMYAIAFARVRGSTGTNYAEESNGVKSKYAEVTRNGVAQ